MGAEVSRADDALEALLVRCWLWVRRHWQFWALLPWTGLALGSLLSWHLLAAAVHLSVATVVFYVLAKLDAIEKAKH